MSQKSKNFLLTPKHYQPKPVFYTQPCYQNGNQLLVNLPKASHSQSMQFPNKHPHKQGRIELPELQQTNGKIPSGFGGQLPVLQEQHGIFIRNMERYCCYQTNHHDATIEAIPSPDLATKHPKIELPISLQRKAITGYTGFIPRSRFTMGISYIPGVKACMDEFDLSQARIRYPTMTSEKQVKQSYWPSVIIYSSAGLLPRYTGFIPGFRDSFGSTFGNTSRQLYCKYSL
ncbi:ciliary microtubule inner protein 2A isoform X2 [Pyxicephalus adspersus]|uniref:Ciliary microtubule inner protein 2A-C-like domain-containing protein n=1 Tax=Pyxicephalus adspersus TaxID=30357 RepID=A0AAV3A129_PYXAD|nr:TPA: hypothetical protein GDO54_017911 [Pyxicephalus adspersus]